MPDPLTDRRGVNAVEGVFLNGFGWAFREQSAVDSGIDAQVEVVEANRLTGKLIALQIKTGSFYFRPRGSDYVYHGANRRLDYWLGHSLPVLLILHKPNSTLTFWQKVRPTPIRRMIKIGAERTFKRPAANVRSPPMAETRPGPPPRTPGPSPSRSPRPPPPLNAASHSPARAAPHGCEP